MLLTFCSILIFASGFYFPPSVYADSFHPLIQLGESVVFPGAGYLAMAVEAIFQKSAAIGRLPSDISVNSVTYKLRNVYFHRMLTLDEDGDTTMELSLRSCSSTTDTWHEFVISSVAESNSIEHCRGLVSIGEHPQECLSFQPLPISMSTRWSNMPQLRPPKS